MKLITLTIASLLVPQIICTLPVVPIPWRHLILPGQKHKNRINTTEWCDKFEKHSLIYQLRFLKNLTIAWSQLNATPIHSGNNWQQNGFSCAKTAGYVRAQFVNKSMVELTCNEPKRPCLIQISNMPYVANVLVSDTKGANETSTTKTDTAIRTSLPVMLIIVEVLICFLAA